MTIVDKLHLGFNTTVNGMGIVFIVLIVLWGIIVVQAKLISYFSKMFKKPEPVSADKVHIERKDITSGESAVSDILDDEIRAVIMAAVSNNADIPLSRLQFNSIKAL